MTKFCMKKILFFFEEGMIFLWVMSHNHQVEKKHIIKLIFKTEVISWWSICLMALITFFIIIIILREHTHS